MKSGKVVLTGGQDGVGRTGDPLDLVEEYDVDSGFIRDLPSMNQARYNVRTNGLWCNPVILRDKKDNICMSN